jgi:hypothetical protein
MSLPRDRESDDRRDADDDAEFHQMDHQFDHRIVFHHENEFIPAENDG